MIMFGALDMAVLAYSTTSDAFSESDSTTAEQLEANGLITDSEYFNVPLHSELGF